MTHEEKIRFLDNLDEAVKVHAARYAESKLEAAVTTPLFETRNAFAKAVHMENYTKELNPPAIGTGDTTAIIQPAPELNSISFKIKVP